MIVYACSTNPGKLAEFTLAASQANLKNLTIKPLPGLKDKIEPPEENGTNFEENASAKALYYSAFTAKPVLVDDSGLEVDALQGAPGVYSARYAGPNATDEENNNLLLRELGNTRHRNARYVCVVALAQAGRILTTARGAVEGVILPALRGLGGFGYDPLFFYPPLNRSFAEFTPEEKFQVSHRGNAFRELFRRLPEVLPLEHPIRDAAPPPHGAFR
jgi:XTP/dITP diphosphohydrolase